MDEKVAVVWITTWTDRDGRGRTGRTWTDVDGQDGRDGCGRAWADGTDGTECLLWTSHALAL